MTPTDSTLLDRHLQAGDETSFAELVRRHLPVVHAAAVRITGSRMLAEEVGQSVFSALAARRAVLPAGLPLIVWLHRTTRSTALNLLRSENRRRRRERDFVFLHGPDDDPRPCPWDRIAPFLDEVIHQLPDAERSLILRRFFSGESHTAIAGEMNLSPDAVRMRMNRALERMRGLLRRQGIHTTASALALSLPAHAAPPVSAALAASAAAAALPYLTAAGGLAFPTLVPAAVMTFKTTTFMAAAAVLLAAGAGFLMLRKEETGTATPLALAPAGMAQPRSIPPAGGISPQGNHAKPEWRRWMDQKMAEAEAQLSEKEKQTIHGRIREIMEMGAKENPPPTPKEAAQFLEQSGKTVEALGWAFTRTGNLDYLREGLAKDPESVFLHFLAAAMRTDKNQQNPEAAVLSQNSLRWLRDHQPAMHAAFQMDGGRPAPPASLEALNNGSFSVVPEDLLKKQDEEFLMKVRGLSAAKAVNRSKSARGYSLAGMLLTPPYLLQDTSSKLVTAQALSKAGGLRAQFLGLARERTEYMAADGATLRELAGDSQENLLRSVSGEIKEVRSLMDLQSEIVNNGTSDQVDELRRLSEEMGERAALEQLRNRRDTAGQPPARTP